MSVTLMHVAKGQDLAQGTKILAVDEANKTVTFFSKVIEDTMRQTGVMIPNIERERYRGKTQVVLGDPEFYKAFTSIYLKNHYTDKDIYRWCVRAK